MERYGRVLWESARWEHDQLNIIAALFSVRVGRLAVFASSDDQITLGPVAFQTSFLSLSSIPLI